MTYLTTKLRRVSTASALALTISLAGGVLGAPSFTAAAQDSQAFSWGFASEGNETDKALSDADIQIKYDGLDVITQLNVTANNGSVSVSRSTPVEFSAFWNYGHFIERSEVRIFDVNSSVQSEPLKVLPVGANQHASLIDMSTLPDDVIYVLRVYGEKGRFDETEAKPLSLFDGEPLETIETINSSDQIGYSIDRTALRNIRVKGASVTVFGDNVPKDSRVTVAKQSVPTDINGHFIQQMILPFGDQTIDIRLDGSIESATFTRDVHLKDTDFFYVAIGDITLGTSSGVAPADFLGKQDQDFGNVSAIGRGATYFKGRVKGDYLVTGSLDTTEERLSDVFNNLDEKDPRQLLRRLDSDRFYPVYGDDSTTVEDAPTQGRFYLKVEKDDSHVLWGNFATQIVGTEFAHLDRGLYGAIGDFRSEDTTALGERVTHVTGFAADPGTIPAREEFRATGGSLYFLNRQDLSIGSERVRIEIRDKVSGLVVETRDLRPQEDYDVDYIQGRILLSDPVQSTARDNQVVRDGALSGNDVFVVVRYEFTPTLTDIDGFNVGGRGTHWFGDHLRLGVTGQRETTDAADQTLFGVDAILRRSAGTYIKGEFAQTNGPGFDQARSTDGGFLFEDVDGQGGSERRANAYRVEAAADLSEFSNVIGNLRGFYDIQEDGFSGANRLISGEVERWGLGASLKLTERSHISIQYDEVDSEERGATRALYGDYKYDLSDKLSLSAGLRHDERDISTGVNFPVADGTRTDVSGQVDYRIDEDISVYAFGQVTIDRDALRQSNDRFGLGGEVAVNERLTLSGEGSYGDGGFGANAQATFARSDNSEFYLGYGLSADRTDTGFSTASQSLSNFGTLTLGNRTRFNDSLSVYGEERFGFGSQRSSQTHVYGLTFNPSEVWSFGASIENGEIEDEVDGSFERTAIAASAGRASDDFRFATNLEVRFEDGTSGGVSRDRTTWLSRNTVSYDANRDLEILGRFNFAISDSDQADFLDADFIEGVAGLAYRPVENDRFNALLKYTFFEDLAPAQQISSGGLTDLPRQRSQIFSIDTVYDLTKKLSVGGKYGFREGEVALSRLDDNFVSSRAQLGVVRLDYHVVKKWDLLGEVRWLSSSLSEDQRFGALAGIYRHVGENAKIGVGYNFSSFSDDLTDFDDDNEGFFINLIGKF